MKQGYSAPKKIGETVKPTQPTNINQVKSPHQSPNESPNQKGWEDFGSFVSAKEQKNTPEKVIHIFCIFFFNKYRMIGRNLIFLHQKVNQFKKQKR